MMYKFFSVFTSLALSLACIQLQAQDLRSPAVPLITIDPYTSVWSFSDKLYDEPTRHWTGRPHRLTGKIRVDGKTLDFMGAPIASRKTIVPTGSQKPYAVKYTFENPGADWMKPTYNATFWKTGQGGFAPDADQIMRTKWNSNDLWVRREVELKDLNFNKLLLLLKHDDNAEVYINGVEAYTCNCWTDEYKAIQLSDQVKSSLKKGKNLIGIHCANTAGGQHLDFGLADEIKPSVAIQPVIQKSVIVKATQSIYDFACGPVDLKVTFTSPLLMSNLDVLSRPVSYVTFDVQSNDGKPHDVQLYFDASAELAVNNSEQTVIGKRSSNETLHILSAGTQSQKMLQTKGDNVRIDWGYVYVAAGKSPQTTTVITEAPKAHAAFTQTGILPKTDDALTAREVGGQPTVLAISYSLGKVANSPVSAHVLVGYDDIQSVEFFKTPLKAWWRRNSGTSFEKMLVSAEKEYKQLIQECTSFDQQLYKDALQSGGEEYAQLCELGYRQAIAAHKLVAGPDGIPFFFSKENFSNGSIGTVDVTYPSAPLFLLYNPTLLKGMMDPIFYYTESGKWTKPFAAHDVGTYPQANGQTYGEDMPVEESGNMLILATAIAEVEGNADYAKKHWKALTTWAEYLKKAGLDPENQLCTDDFAGHLAHNANLSIKAILGIAGYGKLAAMQGDASTATTYNALAKDMAQKWTQMAQDGDHYSLTFDKKGTWSQKYNLVWDKMLGLNIFSPEIAKKEISYYLTKQNKFGLPLDSRKSYTKSDWIIWTATLTNSPKDFQQILHPVYVFANEGPSRIPLSDWHETTNGESVGFRARSVVGGYYIKLLDDYLKKKQSKN
ncbi:DUF4965 domain-containing protein [Cytophagaceae bacterium DM2B3-1]|uniref:DUF4965 domain-containing protein n=1 Tax=Xanthocytophaga flava TaxID=3048013 RepID=A0ABT7CQV8_9BACT|nr:DUF4965 domain-containing protein [Xanthocytophaga flavus]MDJ1495322.1 DUF4965 domain-containing protein [Xanthocytophaga flavus]